MKKMKTTTTIPFKKLLPKGTQQGKLLRCHILACHIYLQENQKFNILCKCRDKTSNLHILLSSAVLEVPTIDFVDYTDTDRKSDQQLATFTLQLLLRFEICSVLRKSGAASCVLVTAATLLSEP